MAADTQHWDVGAYVLGVLDPADLEPFEAHLAGCDSCANEVASLLPVVALLPLADAEAMVASKPRPRSFGPTRPATEPLRRVPRHGLPVTSSGRRLAVAAAVTGVVLVAGSFSAGAIWSTSDSQPTAGSNVHLPNSGATVPSSPTTTKNSFQATDSATGAHASVIVTSTAWGSQLELTIGGVRGPLRCELVAVGADASSTVVASWLVGNPGYGITEQPNPLRIQAATALPLTATSHYDIRATSPDGHVATLVSVPT